MENVKIGGITYSVEQVDVVEVNDDKNCIGACDRQDLVISLLKKLPRQRKDQTLIHEIMHAAVAEAGLEFDDEEDVVNRLSIVLYQVLKDNDFSFLREETSYRVVYEDLEAQERRE